MLKDNFTDLYYLIVVAEEQSFTRAAAKLGVSQSALSHAIKGLEERLGVRLLTRTTRSVAPTEACESLINGISPRLQEIEEHLAALADKSDDIKGNIRITLGEHALHSTVWPLLEKFAHDYPDIHIELNINNGMTDIVSGRFDAGVRLGEHLARDMVAVRIGPDWRMCVVGSPDYLAKKGIPETPHDLHQHNCINMRLPTMGGLYAWEFAKGEQQIRIRVEGQLIFNNLISRVNAAISGLGLSIVPEDSIEQAVAEGKLVKVLEDWCEPFPGYFLYYPSRKQHTSAFVKLIETMRYQ
ncbi:LysR family transcriptional regulator [Pectobacterium jejuense]|uniref:LysR family transcriptional regulator n=1 Tax=Pectobacterium jejuense TaxID=2974022 RepID=A0ABW8GPP6_9GAMM